MKRTDFDFLSKMISLRVSEITVSQDWGKFPAIELAGINQWFKKNLILIKLQKLQIQYSLRRLSEWGEQSVLYHLDINGLTLDINTL